MNESGTSDALASLAAGASEVRWAPRVAPYKIRRLYETDALGLVDEEQIDDVGYALLARCESILEVTAAHRHGRIRCPRCRADVRRHGDPTDPATRDEVIRCGACGWATTWRAYHQTYRGKRLFGANAVPAFAAFARDFTRAATPRQKMVAIDQLIHEVHRASTGAIGRPAVVNVIEGGVRDTIARAAGRRPIPAPTGHTTHTKHGSTLPVRCSSVRKTCDSPTAPTVCSRPR